MRFPNIYLASSWRNKHFEKVLNVLRFQGYNTYDFKHPEDDGISGFSWEKVDKDYENWTCTDFKQGLRHPEAVKAFGKDFHAMQEADLCVLLLPCGRSAHSEAGWMKGQGKKVFVLDLSEKPTPELMYQMFDAYVTRPIDLVVAIETSVHENNLKEKEKSVLDVRFTWNNIEELLVAYYIEESEEAVKCENDGCLDIYKNSIGLLSELYHKLFHEEISVHPKVIEMQPELDKLWQETLSRVNTRALQNLKGGMKND